MEKIQLTKFSHGAGCGCKISPKILCEILKTSSPIPRDEKLIVGYHSRDDAAVYSLGDGKALISTTDFFMPIVDDPFDFGRIASVNAINDVYAMGGRPLMAIAILGWPLDKLSESVARQVLEGGRAACEEVGIPLAGGHSIDNPEPIFGLAVTGIIELKNLKRNDTAEPGCLLYLTKPLGVGILATAKKKGLLKAEHENLARDIMVQFNRLGEVFGRMECVKALTDVTGFGLLGHLMEMCEGSRLKAVIDFNSVPKIPILKEYIEQNSIPGGTNRNWESYGHGIGNITEFRKKILCDPQTSGGLLVALDPKGKEEFEKTCGSHGLDLSPIGSLKTFNGDGPFIEING
jgi:selenide,water dikinase